MRIGRNASVGWSMAVWRMQNKVSDVIQVATTWGRKDGHSAQEIPKPVFSSARNRPLWNKKRKAGWRCTSVRHKTRCVKRCDVFVLVKKYVKYFVEHALFIWFQFHICELYINSYTNKQTVWGTHDLTYIPYKYTMQILRIKYTTTAVC